MLSFSGQLLETVVFHRDASQLNRNLEAVQILLESLPDLPPDHTPLGGGKKFSGSYLWEGVPASDVISFLYRYSSHPAAHRVNGQLLGSFIERMCADGELTTWRVALIGKSDSAGDDQHPYSLTEGVALMPLTRTDKAGSPDRYSIGRLLSPKDESIGLSETAWAAALVETKRAWKKDPGRSKSPNEPATPSGPALRKIRGFGAEGVAPTPNVGLLLLYLLNPKTAHKDAKVKLEFPDDSPPIAAYGISFPASDSVAKVEYVVNNIGWNSDYGPAE
jgi:hypothetical protein